MKYHVFLIEEWEDVACEAEEALAQRIGIMRGRLGTIKLISHCEVVDHLFSSSLL
jgi:hypothetical protein